MAIQNFLSGGYIGKLGETVGQRWRNKRTIRTHVPTNSSRTPAQMTARQQFALANQLSQEAMNFNKGAPAWQTPTNNEWSLRVGTAMKRIRAGLPQNECIPYFPDAVTNNLTINAIDIAAMSHFSNCVFVNNTVNIPNGRTIRFSYHVYNIATQAMETRTIDRTYAHNEQFNMLIPNDNTFLWVNSSWIEGHSIMDNTYNGITITMNRQSLAANVPHNINVPVTFSLIRKDEEYELIVVSAAVPNVPLLLKNLTIQYKYWRYGSTMSTQNKVLDFATQNTNIIMLEFQWNDANEYIAGCGIENQNILEQGPNPDLFRLSYNINEFPMNIPLTPIDEITELKSKPRIKDDKLYFEFVYTLPNAPTRTVSGRILLWNPNNGQTNLYNFSTTATIANNVISFSIDTPYQNYLVYVPEYNSLMNFKTSRLEGYNHIEAAGLRIWEDEIPTYDYNCDLYDEQYNQTTRQATFIFSVYPRITTTVEFKAILRNRSPGGQVTTIDNIEEDCPIANGRLTLTLPWNSTWQYTVGNFFVNKSVRLPNSLTFFDDGEEIISGQPMVPTW